MRVLASKHSRHIHPATGTAKRGLMFCSGCGTFLRDDMNVCPQCGRQVRNSAGSAAGGPVGRRTGGQAIRGASGQRQMTVLANQQPQQGGWQTPSGQAPSPDQGLSITFIENGQTIAQTTLMPGQNQALRFGSAPDNELVVAPPSGTVSGHHGIIVMQGSWCTIRDTNSSNGLYLNGMRQQEFRIAPGDVVSIGLPSRGATRCVIVVGVAGQSWDVFPLAGRQVVRIGRVQGNDLVISDPTVSATHAALQYDGTGWSISDLGSTNGTKVDGRFVTQPIPLYSGSTIGLGNTQAVFLDGCLLLSGSRHGVDVDARNLVRYRKNKGKTIITTDHISLHIKRGEFVAIVGGSGCGKSTILNELNGSEPADEGSVTLDGTDLYANYKMLKSSIGYVPQEDIVYDNLRLEDMLLYAAKLRMQPDTTAQERQARVDEVIDLLELNHVRQNYIGRLSGGQKKRASIAVELLADPRLLFLDEPTSGLDPGIERKLMQRLSEMAREGRTIILVTHTTLNLHLCDQVVFLGAGGKLAYAGDPLQALPFFGVQDFVEVYPLIDENPEYWEQQFAQGPGRAAQQPAQQQPQASEMGKHKSPGFFRQFLTLSARYAKILLNDRARLALMVFQAPLLAYLIHIVAGKGVFEICEDTKFYLFALSCAAFWVGIFDSIQEICKENNIFTRECDGGLRIGSYLASKVLVLGVLCLVQTALLVATLIITEGSPTNALINPVFELMMSTYITVISAMCLGLLVSALFKSPDKALAMAPILIMPQILFSGIAFELNGITEKVSYAINCRWAIEALGTTSDLNDLDLAIYGEKIVIPAETRVLEDQDIEIPEMKKTVPVDTPMGKQEQVVTIPKDKVHFDELKVDVPEINDKKIDANMVEHEHDDMFDHTIGHLLSSWGILLGMSALCVLGCFIALILSMRK